MAPKTRSMAAQAGPVTRSRSKATTTSPIKKAGVPAAGRKRRASPQARGAGNEPQATETPPPTSTSSPLSSPLSSLSTMSTPTIPSPFGLAATENETGGTQFDASEINAIKFAKIDRPDPSSLRPPSTLSSTMTSPLSAGPATSSPLSRASDPGPRSKARRPLKIVLPADRSTLPKPSPLRLPPAYGRLRERRDTATHLPPIRDPQVLANALLRQRIKKLEDENDSLRTIWGTVFNWNTETRKKLTEMKKEMDEMKARTEVVEMEKMKKELVEKEKEVADMKEILRAVGLE